MRFRASSRILFAAVLIGSFSLSISPSVSAAETTSTGPDSTQYHSAVSRAVGFLKSAQADDGSFSGHSGPGITAIVATALMRNGQSPSDPTVSKALRYLDEHIHDDGGIYQDGSNHRNYETCLAVMCFSEANKDGRYDETLKHAENYLKELQWDDGEGHDISSLNYGGAGYGSHKRPDLSNTSFFIDALKSAGAGDEDPALQRALVFVSRCQNLESPHNLTPFAAKVNDGGFYYTCAAGGSSQAGETSDGGLRSYGSMTYAGLKSMIFAGVSPHDERVKAAKEWISKHYTLQENPGMGAAGLYYYYHTFAKALDAIGNPVVEDPEGNSHDWRSDLVEQLAKQQQANGSWVNSNARWLEGDPNLVTSYALLALSYCQPE